MGDAILSVLLEQKDCHMNGAPLLVPRTCLRHQDAQDGEVEPPMPLTSTRAFPAYVLLADPGAGKTRAFETEAAASGGRRVSAGDFLALAYPELRGTDVPVFVDGLDETRAGTMDGRVPLDQIRGKLQQLGCRRWRISCRAAEWLGQTDVDRLRALLPEDETVQVFTLQPLTLDDVAAILAANHGIADTQAFIDTAKQHGLTDLLLNPQTLEMLAKAVGPDNRWPASRLQVYDMACARLAQEHNAEHVAATRKVAPDQTRLRRAAGFLCTVQLIADLAGFTHTGSAAERVVALNAIPNPEALPLAEALASRLFKEAGRDMFAPVHRTVAEFLAAGYLAQALKGTLTLRRVLALICGTDGGIVSGMRGLGAWLASLSTDARPTLTRLDPLGLLLYGDAFSFSATEKVAVMEGLGEAIALSPSFRWHDWDGRPFPVLVTPDMRTARDERLASADRSDPHQVILLTLLEGLRHTVADATVAPVLLAMTRDATLWQSVRLRALKVYVQWMGTNGTGLRALLDDIAAGTVVDNDDEILGALLAAMHPTALPSTDLPPFLHPPKRQNLIGKYTRFWRHDLAQVDAAELPTLLDAFAQRSELRRSDTTRDYAKAVGGLLVRALEGAGDDIPDDCLLTWLDACCGKHTQSLLENDDKQAVAQWLDARPQRYFGLLDHALERFWSDQGRAWPALARLHGARTPSAAPAWWLAKAEVATHEARAKEYFVQAVRAIPHESGPDIDAQLVAFERVAQQKNWEDSLTALLTCDLEQHGWRLEDAVRKRARAREAAERRAWFRGRLSDFARPDAPLELLEPVVLAHEHRHYDIDGDTPEARLLQLFDGDHELVEAALQMLRATVARADLPGIQATLDDAAQGQVPHLNAAFLIGLELRYRTQHKSLDDLSDDRLTAALVAHLTYTRDEDDTWVETAARSRPQCMVDALNAYLAAALHWKDRSPNGIYLLRRASFREATRRCVLPLLARFPLRSHPNHRGALSDLLHAALNLAPRDELLALVKARVEAPKLDGAQRAAWLATGLLLDPDRYLPLVTCYLGKRPPSVDAIAGFLHYRRETGETTNAPSSKVLGVLIEHFAPGCSADRITGAGRVTAAMNRAEQVRLFIHDLAGRPDAESTAQLARLEKLSAMAGWLRTLREARAGQQILRRDATFERSGWEQVCATLQHGRPSTAAEIAAVVNDTIEDLKDQIRYSGLNPYLAYWNTDSHKKALQPRHEEVCRDAFGDQLRVRLERFELGCEPETHHADGKRSDLWVTSGPIGVPIEVKLDRHGALWTAATGQLLARYAADPRARGFGVYVVFWFGEPKEIPAPPSGARPSTPQELQAMLKAGLTEEQRRAITVHVVDCSVRATK